MVWQYSPYYIPFLATGLITLILAVTAWRNRSSTCAKPFALLMLAAAIWAFGSALEVSSADLPSQMLAITLAYPGIVTVPVAWLLFSFEYSGREHWITPGNIALLFAVPVISLFLVSTNSYHHLFYSSVTQMSFGGLNYLDITYGPVFWFYTIYSYLIIYVAVMFILQRFVFTSSLYRGQMIAILIAVFTPFFVNLAYAVRQIGFAVIDPTPFVFVISGFAIIVGMMRYQLLDIMPMAHDQIIANMSDGIVVIDAHERIISLNAPAERILGLTAQQSVGIPAQDLVAEFASTPDAPGSPGGPRERYQHMEREIDGKKRYFELRFSPIRSGENDAKGTLIVLRDITTQKVAEIDLALARKKLNLLSSITRHDILNQVTVLLLNIDTAKDIVERPEARLLLDVQENAVKSIQHQIEFARDYENLGGKAPQWMNVGGIFAHLLPVMGTYDIRFAPPDVIMEVYADPLLERVFYNLVDNSIQHGGKIKTIGIRYIASGDALTLVYYDDGNGIPLPDKERIFERGVGKHTGLGLFLAREILEITGMSIRETGTPGTGARFEIRVPSGKFRQAP